MRSSFSFSRCKLIKKFLLCRRRADADHRILPHQIFLNVAADPPNGVGDQTNAFVRIEFLHRVHEADVAFLNEVDQSRAELAVFGCDLDDKTQIRGDQLLGRLWVAGFAIANSEFVFLLASQKRVLANFSEVASDRVRCSNRRCRFVMVFDRRFRLRRGFCFDNFAAYAAKFFVSGGFF